MRILCLDIPAPGATLEHYAPHLTAEALHAWGLYKSGFIRDIYFRQDRPGVAISSSATPWKRRIMSWPNFRWQKRVY
ncbi:superoxide dismutase [Klebsiella pneumoniae]|uniref:Superoxide dismutase n=1 Tax=Klebsiella pneumoniae TaxID=573 RepID=A0A2X1QIJ4_KLEPN|nr:superoxide dismutase [Klebsiella pneumoniae]